MITSSHRQRGITIVLGVTVLLTGLAPSGAHAAGPGAGTWVQQAPHGVPAYVPDLFAVQCPAANECYALGSPPLPTTGQPALLHTTDGGASWTTSSLETTPYVPDRNVAYPLSCPATTTCYLLAGAVTGQGTPQSPGGTPVPSGKAQIWETNDSGRTWTHRSPTAAGTLQAISCPTASLCYVVAAGSPSQDGSTPELLLVTRDGGTTWASRDLSGSVTAGAPAMFTCPDADTCYLGASLPNNGGPPATQALMATHDGGVTWSSWQVGQQLGYRSISCPSADTCYSAGNASVLYTHDGGQTWAWAPAPWQFFGPPFLTCPTTTTCVGFQYFGDAWRTTDGAVTWTRQTNWPSGNDVACPGPTTCYVVGPGGLVYKTVDGTSWREPTPYTRAPLDTVSCPAAGTCYAGGSRGTVLSTRDSGASWSMHQAGTGDNISQLSCPAPGTCLALAGSYPSSQSTILKTSDGGRTWQSLKVLPPGFLGQAVCPSTSDCVVAVSSFALNVADGLGTGGELMLRTLDGGRTWSTSALPEGYSVSSLACPSAQECLAVGGQSPCDDSARRGSPTSGTAATRRRPNFPCNEELGWIFASTDGGRHWRRTVFRSQFLTSVSCSSVSDCSVSGDGLWGHTTSGGAHWSFRTSQSTSLTPSPPINDLSCFSATTCWALRPNVTGGLVPVLTTDSGKTWTAVTRGLAVPSPSYGSGLMAMTCQDVDHCVGVGVGGVIQAYSP